tara:strand:- start:1732 stop:3501 length:1770 start_codon:yes stop_codon:yes gene_type:complete
MDPRDWSRIQQGIFAGESGGDYGALFGYQNRPNGRFSNVNLTDMTVDQALDFARPSGPYGQYVKGQVGRVATPMGAYQVVGTTLRGAKEGLGLTGGEQMTTALQDKIGQWIYKTQGTGAWEGYKPMTDAQAIAAQTMTALGKQPQGQASTQGAAPMMQQEQKPRGLLGSLGIQKMEEGAEGETGQRFYNRDSFKDTAAILAQGFGRMGIMGMEEIADSVAKQRTEAKAQNKTIEMLGKMGTPQAMSAIEYINAGGAATDALKIAFAKPEKVTPYTDAAKLRADFDRGLISQDELEAATQRLAQGKQNDTTDFKNYQQLKVYNQDLTFEQYMKDKNRKPLQEKGAYRVGEEILGGVTFDPNTGEHFVLEDGLRVPIDISAATPVTDSTFANAMPKYTAFEKLDTELRDDKTSMDRLQDYMKSVGNTNTGFRRLGDQMTTALKTLLSGVAGADWTSLSTEELNTAVAQGQLQGLLGRFRIETVGGGVMTEQDALRIISNLGGDVNALQNPEIVAAQIERLFRGKLSQFETKRKRHDAGVDAIYGGMGFEKVGDYDFDESVFDLRGPEGEVPPPIAGAQRTKNGIEFKVLDN